MNESVLRRPVRFSNFQHSRLSDGRVSVLPRPPETHVSARLKGLNTFHDFYEAQIIVLA